MEREYGDDLFLGKRDCWCVIIFVMLGLGCVGGDLVCEGEWDYLEDEGGVEEE